MKVFAPLLNIALFGLMLYGIYWGISRIVQVVYFIH